MRRSMLVAALGLVAIALSLLLFRPLVPGKVGWAEVGPGEGLITFELRNRAPQSITVDKIAYPFDTTHGVTFGEAVLTNQESEAPLRQYRIGALKTVRVSVPVYVEPDARVSELRLNYRMLGIPKHALVSLQDLNL